MGPYRSSALSNLVLSQDIVTANDFSVYERYNFDCWKRIYLITFESQSFGKSILVILGNNYL